MRTAAKALIFEQGHRMLMLAFRAWLGQPFDPAISVVIELGVGIERDLIAYQCSWRSHRCQSFVLTIYSRTDTLVCPTT